MRKVYRTNTVVLGWTAAVAVSWVAMISLALAEPPKAAEAAKSERPAGAAAPAPVPLTPEEIAKDIPATRIPNIVEGAEFYFSPDGKKLVGNVKPEGGKHHLVHVLNVDGSDVRVINDKGSDACTYFFPDGKRIIWTSTRDNTDYPAGDWSKPWDYPTGAEIYTSNIDGTDVRRLTHNKLYEAEVSVRHDGKYVIFGRQTDGKLDLWRANPDGSEEFQITRHEGREPGRGHYIGSTNRILYRAWRTSDQVANSKSVVPRPLPMDIFSVNDDGTDLRQHTHDGGSNWSPFPAPDAEHFVFAKLHGPGRNYEITLASYNSDEQIRLTYNNHWEGMPSISPDGKWLVFSSSRDSVPGGKRFVTSYLADISKYNVGPKDTTSPAKRQAKAGS